MSYIDSTKNTSAADAAAEELIDALTATIDEFSPYFHPDIALGVVARLRQNLKAARGRGRRGPGRARCQRTHRAHRRAIRLLLIHVPAPSANCPRHDF